MENALYHGIKNKRGKGMIRIEGELDGEDCILLITDNGKGMTPERLEQVRKGIRNRKARETDIYGLYNVNERIRLNFGENYGITIPVPTGRAPVSRSGFHSIKKMNHYRKKINFLRRWFFLP